MARSIAPERVDVPADASEVQLEELINSLTEQYKRSQREYVFKFFICLEIFRILIVSHSVNGTIEEVAEEYARCKRTYEQAKNELQDLHRLIEVRLMRE